MTQRTKHHKEWLVTPDGIAQTERDEFWNGLRVEVITARENADGTRSANLYLIGLKTTSADPTDDEPYPETRTVTENFRYAEIQLRQYVDFLKTRKLTDINIPHSHLNARQLMNLNVLQLQAFTIATLWDRDAGQPVGGAN